MIYNYFNKNLQSKFIFIFALILLFILIKVFYKNDVENFENSNLPLVKYIRVFNTADGNYLELSQITVFNNLNVNIARKAKVSGSGVDENTFKFYNLTPNIVIDGTYETRNYPYIYRSGSNDKNVYLELNLDKPYSGPLAITIYNKSLGNKRQLENFKLELLDENKNRIVISNLLGISVQGFQYEIIDNIPKISEPLSLPDVTIPLKANIVKKVISSLPSSTKVRYIKISNSVDEKYLILSQVTVFNDQDKNIVKDKLVTGSGFRNDFTIVYEITSNILVDGNYNNRNIPFNYHSSTNNKDTFVLIDLGEPQLAPLAITIYGSSDQNLESCKLELLDSDQNSIISTDLSTDLIQGFYFENINNRLQITGPLTLEQKLSPLKIKSPIPESESEIVSSMITPLIKTISKLLNPIRYIKISLTVPNFTDYLYISQIVVKDYDGINIAKNKPILKSFPVYNIPSSESELTENFESTQESLQESINPMTDGYEGIRQYTLYKSNTNDSNTSVIIDLLGNYSPRKILVYNIKNYSLKTALAKYKITLFDEKLVKIFESRLSDDFVNTFYFWNDPKSNVLSEEELKEDPLIAQGMGPEKIPVGINLIEPIYEINDIKLNFPLRYVSIRNKGQGSTYLNLSQVMVWDNNGNNLALNKVPETGSVYQGTVAKTLTDGYEGIRDYPNIFYSEKSDANVYVTIDLQGNYYPKNITIYNINSPNDRGRVSYYKLVLLDANLNLIFQKNLTANYIQSFNFIEQVYTESESEFRSNIVLSQNLMIESGIIPDVNSSSYRTTLQFYKTFAIFKDLPIMPTLENVLLTYKVRYVKIENINPNDTEYLNLSQVVVKDENGNNISKNKTVYTPNKVFGTNPMKLTDGEEKTRDLPNIFHSGTNDSLVYALIDLGSSYNISNITIYNRETFSSRLAKFKVVLFDDFGQDVFEGRLTGDLIQSYKFIKSASQNTTSLTGEIPNENDIASLATQENYKDNAIFKGIPISPTEEPVLLPYKVKYVKIQPIDPNDTDFLNLSQIVVYNEEFGNLAKNKVVYTPNKLAGTEPSNLTTGNETVDDFPNIYQSGTNDSSVYILIDLQDSYYINNISIYNRKTFNSRLSKFKIVLFNDLGQGVFEGKLSSELTQTYNFIKTLPSQTNQPVIPDRNAASDQDVPPPVQPPVQPPPPPSIPIPSQPTIRFIKITSDQGAQINLSRVVIKDISNTIISQNLAVTGSGTAFVNGVSGTRINPQILVNGQGQNLAPSQGYRSSITDNPYVLINLGKNYDYFVVNVYNPIDTPSDLMGFSIHFLDQDRNEISFFDLSSDLQSSYLFDGISNPYFQIGPMAIGTFDQRPNMIVRYIKISRVDNVGSKYLTLSQVTIREPVSYAILSRNATVSGSGTASLSNGVRIDPQILINGPTQSLNSSVGYKSSDAVQPYVLIDLGKGYFNFILDIYNPLDTPEGNTGFKVQLLNSNQEEVASDNLLGGLRQSFNFIVQVDSSIFIQMEPINYESFEGFSSVSYKSKSYNKGSIKVKDNKKSSYKIKCKLIL